MVRLSPPSARFLIEIVTGQVQQFTSLCRTYRLVWQAAGGTPLFWGGLLSIQGMLPAVNVGLARTLVVSLQGSWGQGVESDRLWSLLIPLLGMLGVIIATASLRQLTDWIGALQTERIQDHVTGLIHQQLVRVDLAAYELPEYHDQLSRARNGSVARVVALVQNTGTLVRDGTTIVGLVAVLSPLGLRVPLLVLLATLPTYLVAVVLNRRQYNWWRRTTQDQRRVDYYDACLSHGAFAADLRLFDLGDHFQQAYRRLRHQLVRQRLRLMATNALVRLGAILVLALCLAAGGYWMAVQILRGQFSLGDLALIYQAFNASQAVMSPLVKSVGQLYQGSLFLGDLFVFLTLQPQITDPPQPRPMPTALTQSIQLQDITFGYPNTQTPVLKHFDLKLPAGQITAVVGDNGAGKSTLVKLLSRFYDPSQGAILWDGIDIRQFNVADLRRQLTVLMQFPVGYEFTALENIALGNIHHPVSEIEVSEAAAAARAHEIIERLPQGYQTQLGKQFSQGTELSGGEWQRLALARAFLRQTPLIILDEPTSAMDPWAEMDWLQRFRQLAQGRTALVITHRFTLARSADRIHVMQQGQIIESGAHEELLQLEGFYASSWRMQMEDHSTLSPVIGDRG